MKPKDFPIPEQMQHLKLDSRGFPIPFVVLVDKTGKPHFTVNAIEMQMRCLQENLCHVCGKGLYGPAWFAGGPLSAFHPHGTYIDGAMHGDCMHYAMQVCPYLAAPNYRNRIDDKTLKLAGNETFKGAVIRDNTMIPDRPVLFVTVLALGESLTQSDGAIYHTPNKPYLAVEYWQGGKRLTQEAGDALVQEVLNLPVPEPRAPTITLIK